MRRFRILISLIIVILSFILVVSAIELSHSEAYYKNVGADLVIHVAYDINGKFLSCDLQHVDDLQNNNMVVAGAASYKEFVVTNDWQPFPEHTCSFGAAGYVWDLDENTCTASAVCVVCGNEVTETVSYTIKSSTTATCSQPGSIVYLAQFENSQFENQRYERTVTVKHKRNYTVLNEWQVEVRCSVCGELLDTLSFPDYQGYTYQAFTKLTNAQKIAIENEMGETIYNRWVLYLKEKQEAIEFGGEV